MSQGRIHRFGMRATVALVATGALLAAGIAFAAWTATGSGSGYAKAGTVQTLTTVDVSSSIVGDLYPGGTGTVSLKVHNPNAFPVTVTGVTFGAVSPSTCSVTVTSPSNVSFSVAANSDSTLQVYAGAAAMGTGAGDACQGQVFTVATTLSGTTG
jgi:hypothetical protein